MAGKPWTEDEEIYLELYYNDPDNTDLNAAIEFLGRSHESIRCKATRMRKEREFRSFKKIWTEADDEYLKKNYLRYPYWQIARHFGVTKMAVCERVITLKLPKKYKSLMMYDGEIKRMAKEGKYRSEIAEACGLRLTQINTYVRRHKIDTAKVEFKPKNKDNWFRQEDDVFWNYIRGRI